MYEAVENSLIIALLNRVGATGTGTAKERWLRYLQAQTASAGTLTDLEKKFFKSKGGTGETIHELVGSYLSTKGHVGTHADKAHNFCNTATVF